MESRGNFVSEMNSKNTSSREQLEKAGFAIVPDVLSRETVEQMIIEIGSVLHQDDQAVRREHAMRHLLRSVPAVRTMTESACIRRLVEPVLGPDFFVVRSIFFDKTERANWKVPWHQDLTIAVQERIDVPGFTAWSVKDGIAHVQPPFEILERMLTVRLHLDDCDESGGPLQVIPGSHKSGRVEAGNLADWKQRQSPEVCIVPSGGAVLMRPLLLHASSAAVTPSHRRVVHLEFAAESLPSGLPWVL